MILLYLTKTATMLKTTPLAANFFNSHGFFNSLKFV
jgi:hypothetical protein